MRRRYRIALAVSAVLIALPVLLLVGLYWLGNNEAGRAWIERLTAQLTDGGVRLSGIGGHFPEDLRLARLELRDPQGLWLTVDDVRLQWSPSQLWSWRAQVALLQAAHASVERAPVYPSRHKPTSRPHHWPEVHVDRLAVERLDLGASLTGNAVALSIEGNGSWVSLGQTALALDARRLDSVPSIYHATARIDDRQLSAQLEVAEDADGPLAHLIQLPDLGALSIHLQLAGPRSAVNTQLALHAGTLSARVDGVLDARSGDSDLTVVLDSDAMAPRPGLGWRRVHVQGRWHGPARKPDTEADLDAAEVVVPGVSLSSLSARLEGHGGAVVLTARAGGLVLPGKLGSVLASAPLEARATMHLDQADRPLEFTLSHALLEASGRWSGRAAEGNGTLEATLPNLKPLATLAGLDLGGRGRVSGSVHSRAGDWHIEATGELEPGGGGQSPLLALLAPRSTVSAVMTFNQRGLQLERSRIESKQLQASAQGEYVGEALNMSWQATLPEVAALAPRFSGRATAQGQVRGEAPRLALTADVEGDLAVNGSRSGPVRAHLRASDIPQRPLGELELSGTLDEAPVEFHASLSAHPDGSMEAMVDRGSWKSLRARAAVSIPADARRSEGARTAKRARAPQPGKALRGEMQFSMQQLADLDRLLGQQLQGSIEARVDFDGSVPGGQARVHVTAHDAGVPAQQLKTLELGGSIDALTTRPTLALQLSAQTLVREVPSQLHAQLNGPLDAVALQVKASSEGDEDTRVELMTSATLDAAGRSLRLQSLELEYHGQKARLLSPGSISFGNGLAVDQLRLGVGDCVLQARGRISPTLDLRASVHEWSPDLLRPWFPNLQIDGRANLDVDLHGTPGEPQGSVHLEGHGLRARTGSGRALPAGEITAEAQLQSSVAQVQIKAGAGDSVQLQIAGQAPLTRDAPIGLKLGGTVDLLALNPFIESSGQRLHGTLKLDADIAGSMASPQAHGSLDLTHADLHDYPRGLHLTDINAKLAADGDRLRLQELEAHAGPGTVSVSGSLGLAGELPLSLKLEAHNARPLNSDLITATLDMDLSLSGPMRAQLDAAGQLHIIRADLNIPNALPPSVAVLNVRRIGQKPVPPPKENLKVNLNLTVDAPRAVFVRGRGLDAELGGELHVGGNNNEPSISGGFDLRHGTMNLAGSTLTFTSGRVSFNGTGVKKKIDPTLDFVASTTSGNATYYLNVGGYADAPVITLSSTPEQPQDQILSRLLFGADPAQLTTLQIAQIAAALATMSGVGGGGLNPLNAVQRKLGLDRLAISGSTNSGPATGTGPAQGAGNTGATIEAGRYVSSRVFVGAKQFTTGTTQAEVQVDLTKNLKIQTAVGTGGGTVQGESPQNDPGSSIGLSYQFEY